MRLLLISAAFPPMASGEAANTAALARRLCARGVEVHVLTTRYPDLEAIPGVRVHAEMDRWSFAEAPRFAAALRRLDPDAILLMYLGGIYEYESMITFAPTLARRVLGRRPFVARFENPFSLARPEQMSLFGRVSRKALAALLGSGVHYEVGTLLRDSGAIVVLCQRHLDVLRSMDPSVTERASVIPPPCNVDVVPDPDGELRREGRQRIAAAASAFVIGFVGYLYRDKGIETLLRAMAELVARGEDVRLVVLGGRVEVKGVDDGAVSYLDSMKALAGSLGLASRIAWTGTFRAVDRQVAANLHACDAFALPFDDGIHLNNSSFGVLATYGAPVVSTFSPHMDRAFVDGENVLLCPPRDPVALANALGRLIHEQALRERLRKGVSELAQREFSWDEAIDRTLATLTGPASGGN